MSDKPITLTPEELRELTGHTQKAAQLRELLRRGFWRARRRDIDAAVVLERAHYEAVCAGAQLGSPPRKPEPRPMLLSERLALEASRAEGGKSKR